MRIVWFILVLLYACEMKGQDLKTIMILNERLRYFHLAELLQQDANKSFATQAKFSKILAIEYTFITIQLLDESSERKEIWLEVKISKSFNILEVWCKDKSLQQNFESIVQAFEQTSQINERSLWLEECQKEKVVASLQLTDRIAKVGYSCTSGDSYTPSFYSKILITEMGIELNQINYWNAYSLDTKNYCMRKLFFFIPFNQLQEQDINNFKKNIDAFSYQYINNVLIHFSDHSSPSYKECGEKIILAIENEMSKK